MSFGSAFVLTLFTNEPSLAERADAAGIDRVGVDVERLRKEDRQDHAVGWISDHEITDLPAVARALKTSAPFGRVNPIHASSGGEIEAMIAGGASVVMLPYFRTCADVEKFVRLVDGRATVSLLLETAAATARIDEILQVAGVDEVHVGLNDLHLDMGLDSHFELLVSPVMPFLAERVARAGVPFGFGGVGRLGDTTLPVPPDIVYAQYPRLGATRALVSRVFLGPEPDELDLTEEVGRFRARMDWWAAAPDAERQAAFDALYHLSRPGS